jgi:hypothetical protein
VEICGDTRSCHSSKEGLAGTHLLVILAKHGAKETQL